MLCPLHQKSNHIEAWFSACLYLQGPQTARLLHLRRPASNSRLRRRAKWRRVSCLHVTTVPDSKQALGQPKLWFRQSSRLFQWGYKQLTLDGQTLTLHHTMCVLSRGDLLCCTDSSGHFSLCDLVGLCKTRSSRWFSHHILYQDCL